MVKKKYKVSNAILKVGIGLFLLVWLTFLSVYITNVWSVKTGFYVTTGILIFLIIIDIFYKGDFIINKVLRI